MKKLILFFLFLFFSAAVFSQQYKTHAVKEGETLESISRNYKVTPHDIIKLNPELKDGKVKPNSVLIIPGETTGQVKTEIKREVNEDANQVTFFIHKVKSKETLYGIAKMYNVTIEDIKRYNKHLYSTGLDNGEKINIPRYTPVPNQVEELGIEAVTDNSNLPPVQQRTITEKTVEKEGAGLQNTLGVIDTTKYKKQQDLLSFKTHKVKRRETLYSLAKEYNVTVNDIKRYNKELYARPLDKGDKIQIPVFKITWVKKEVDPLQAEKDIHIIKPKETRWGIANSYGLTIDQLKKLNPEMGEIIKIGDTLTIPKKVNTVNVPSSDTFVFYEVKPKETLYSLIRTFKISNDSLQMYNPALKDGLKAGMILKLPKGQASGLDVENSLVVKKFSLLDSINPGSTSKIAVFIPFRLEAIDFNSKKDIERNIEKSSNLNVALDFHTGVLMALDSLKEMGLSVNAKILDSEASGAIVTDLTSLNNNFKGYDAIIGPFVPEAFNRLSDELRNDSIPLFSPFSSNIEVNRNVFQTVPADDAIRAEMITYIKENVGDRQLIIISDKENEEVKKKLMSELPPAKILTPIENTFIRLDDINPLLSKKKENWVIVETNNIALLTNVSGVLNSAKVKDVNITMFATKRGSAYDSENVSNFHLSNLNFHYPTVYKNSPQESSFSKAYQKKYKEIPNRYAIRGYDMTMDVVLRLAYNKNLFKTSRYVGETKYVENKFEYDSNYQGGHYNKGVYIVKYQDMEIVEVEPVNDKLLVENK